MIKTPSQKSICSKLFLMLLTAALVLTMPVQVPAQSVETTYPWPMFRHDPARTGYTESAAPSYFEVGWTYATGGMVRSSPAIVDGKVYIGSDDKNVYCLDANSGTLVWKYETGGSIYSSPAVVDGKVYVGSGDNAVYCLNAASGNLVWKNQTGGMVQSSPAVVDGKVYVGSDDGSVYCLDGTSGTIAWRYETNGTVRSSPAVADGKVYITSHDENVYCLDATNGTQVWKTETFRLFDFSPAVVDGKVYIASDIVCCLDGTNGSQIWWYTSEDIGTVGGSSPTVKAGRVYVGAGNGVACINAVTGKEIWTAWPIYMFNCTLSVADNRIYIAGDTQNRLLCLSLGDEALGAYRGTNKFESTPAIADGKIYVGNNDGSVYCFVESAAPKIPVTITCWVYPTSITMGENLIVSGAIYPTVANATVTLNYTKPDTTTIIRTATSRFNGSYTDYYFPDAIGNWTVRSSWPGSADFIGANSTAVTFTVKKEASPVPATGVPMEYIYVIAALIVVAVIAVAAYSYTKKKK